MFVPRYSEWIIDDASKEQVIAHTIYVIRPATLKGPDELTLQTLLTKNPWLLELLEVGGQYFDLANAAYRVSSNDVMITMVEFVDAVYSMLVTACITSQIDKEKLRGLDWCKYGVSSHLFDHN